MKLRWRLTGPTNPDARLVEEAALALAIWRRGRQLVPVSPLVRAAPKTCRTHRADSALEKQTRSKTERNQQMPGRKKGLFHFPAISDTARHPILQVDFMGFETRPDVEKALRERINRMLAGEPEPPRRGGRRKTPSLETPATTEAAAAPKPRLVTRGRNWTAPEEPPGYEGLYPKNDDDWNEFADVMLSHRSKVPRSNIGPWKRMLVKEGPRWFDLFGRQYPAQFAEWKSRRRGEPNLRPPVNRD